MLQIPSKKNVTIAVVNIYNVSVFAGFFFKNYKQNINLNISYQTKNTVQVSICTLQEKYKLLTTCILHFVFYIKYESPFFLEVELKLRTYSSQLLFCQGLHTYLHCFVDSSTYQEQ